MRVGFTGTQRGMTREQQLGVLQLLKGFAPSEFHHGDCIGADGQAHDIAVMLQVPQIHIWPPTISSKRAWKKAPQVVLRPDAGYLERNWNIVTHTDVLIACPKLEGEERRSGTWATIRAARRKAKPVFIVWPKGEVTHEQAPAIEAAAPKPRVLPGPCVYKIRKNLSPIHGELIGFRVLVAVPNMDGHKAFSTEPYPSFSKKHRIYESSDFGDTEVVEQLKRILKHLITAGYGPIEHADDYAERLNAKSTYELNEAQHKVRLTPEQQLSVDLDAWNSLGFYDTEDTSER